LKLLEQQGGSFVEGFDVGAREPVGDGQPGEREALDRVAGKHRKAGGVLRVILNELGVDADRLSESQGFLLGLVEVVAAAEDGETGGNGAVKEVRLGEAKHEASLQVAELSGESQSLPETQEIVGLIG
jgi:hypothetical protein